MIIYIGTINYEDNYLLLILLLWFFLILIENYSITSETLFLKKIIKGNIQINLVHYKYHL